ncbi:MAG: hypothetical protein K2G09_09790 [Paramuribaculum sp.]|nr:hypothetical protein [Paramuribaculum sp.]
MATFFKLLFQLILSPYQGWSDVSHDSVPVNRLLSAGFYPLILLTALAVFLQGVYHPGFTFIILFEKCIVVFVEYFISFFIARFIFTSFIHRYITSEISEKRNDTFIIFPLSLLALATLVENCIPIYMPIREFFAIYVAIIMWRGTRYMAVRSEKVESFMIMSILAVIVPPFVIGFLFNAII